MSPTASILSGLILGSIGMGYCLYGKKQQHKIAFWSGVVLIAMPYCVDSLIWLVLFSLVVMALPKYLKF